MRRALLPLLIALAAAAAGCGGTPPAQARSTVKFISDHAALPDAKLARLCPSLYPSDFLRRRKHYRYDEKDLKYTPSEKEKAAAQAAGCTEQGTKPKE